MKHGYTQKWQDWPWSSAAEFLERVGRETAEKIWREFPILGLRKEMGRGLSELSETQAFRKAGVQSTDFSRVVSLACFEEHYPTKVGTLNTRYSERSRY